MNIEKAKQEIIRTLRAYRKTLPDGSLKIPVEKQRPLLMIGPPGIGKTAIMNQIARETGEGLMSYSMTHHTRQSAIGLPMIERRNYGGVEQAVTEYTMSEIVASLYDYMEQTGKKRGILFLDEINCVSETLTPVMLQLLQNKTFGTHALPEGWIIVAAGNPPEYNRAVREFDMATKDRVKNMDIEPDLEIWQHYALERRIHPAIRTYLTVYPEHFYVIREVEREQLFVTARGWEDLSLMLDSCEEDGEAVDEEMILQYLRDPQVARDFFTFYDLFGSFGFAWEQKEGPDFRQTLRSEADRLRDLPEVSCLALSSMLFSQLQKEAHDLMQEKACAHRVRELLGVEFFRREELLLLDTERVKFFDHQMEEITRRRKIGRLKPAEVMNEKQALRILEDELRVWLKGDRTFTFSAMVEERLKSEEIDRSRRETEWKEHLRESEEILGFCSRGDMALRYLRADLERDPDTSACEA